MCAFVETGSESFQRFLHLLGDTITLKGWSGYRGGLDTKSKNSPEAIKRGVELHSECFFLLHTAHIVYIIVTKQFQSGLPRMCTGCSAPPGKSQVSLSHWYGMQL